MVALAKAMLLEPEVLLIDELSLGLSPIAAQQVLAKVEQLRDEGLTIVIVEQSVNVALSIADRAVFMEKGQVRFDGPADELLERGDLLRAVFLGGDRRRSRPVATHDARSASSPSLGIDLNPQDLFDGAVTGLVYGFLAIGVILLYRASGIVNFAYGAIGSLAAVLVAKMVIDWNWPYVPALARRRGRVGRGRPCAIEMTVVRRLFDSARITLFVATIGVAQLVTVLVINVPRVEGVRRHVPDAVQRHLAARRRHHRARAAGRGARGDPAGRARRSAGSSTAPSGASPSPPRRPTPTPAAWPG